MAHATQPHHVPHEQLRTEAPSQRPHSDKYVSAFVSGSATVDMSFRNPVLGKSADHFKVGIDELTGDGPSDGAGPGDGDFHPRRSS
mgnify:CR=1 FL=1